jgi:PAS domain S-box-containing protein
MEFAASEEVGLAVFRESNDALIVFDLESLAIVAANPTLLRIARTDFRQLAGRRVTDFIQSDSEDLAAQLSCSLNDTQFFHSREGYHWEMADRPAIPVNVSISRIHSRPKPFGLLVLRDVSERVSAMRKLSCEATFRKAIVDHAADGVCVFHRDPDNRRIRFTVWNGRMAALTGYSIDQINQQGGLPTELQSSVGSADCGMWMEQALAGTEFRGAPWNIMLPEGEHRVLTVSTSTFSAVDATFHVLAVVQDVTERKRNEEAVARRDAILAAANYAGEQFLRRHALEATLPDVLSRIGHAAGVSRVYVFESHPGPESQLLTSQRYEWVADGIEPQIGNPELQAVPCENTAYFCNALERGESVFGLVSEMPEGERRILEPQGIISLAAMPIHVAGVWYGFIGFDDCLQPRQWQQMELDALRMVADMLGAAFERKQAEELRLRSQKLEALGVLSGGIAHEFNNILCAISGCVELAKGEMTPEHPARESLTRIAAGCDRASELIRHILAFSHPHEPGREALHLQPVVEEAVKLLRPTLSTMIQMRTHFASDLPPVLAKFSQLHQIVVNLTTNAAHAIGSKGGWIEFRLEEVSGNGELRASMTERKLGRCVCLSIRDNGCGMDRLTLNRIFDPFFTTKPFGHGTGLGLPIVHGIVNSYGGEILVDSQPGMGTTFRLFFPVAEPSTETLQAAGPMEQQPVSDSQAARGARLLYVDDEEPLVFLAKRLLQRIGYVVTGFTDPIQAFQEFQTRPDEFDALVTDLAMPGMSGFDLVRRVREIRPELPIVMTSGYVRPEDEKAAFQLGVRSLVLKPNTVDELAPVLDRLLGSCR